MAPPEAVLRSLVKEWRRGVRRVHLVGGEPTLHPQFLPILKAAKRIGYSTVVVSNGVRFASPSFCRQALPYIDEVILSLHGHDARTHERLTCRPGSFEGVVRALESTSKGGGRVSVNTTVTASNLDSLLPISRMILGFGVRKYHCLNAVPLGRGERRFLDLTPELRKCSAVLPRLARECWRSGLQLLVAGFPLCTLGAYHRCSIDWGGEYVTDRVRASKVVFEKAPGEPRDFRIDLGRIKTSKCRSCALDYACAGIFARYYEKRGDGELNPVPRTG